MEQDYFSRRRRLLSKIKEQSKSIVTIIDNWENHEDGTLMCVNREIEKLQAFSNEIKKELEAKI